MTSVGIPTTTGDMSYEAAPDVEVTFLIMQGNKLFRELPANINIAKTVLQLKQIVSRHCQKDPSDCQIMKGEVCLSDERRLLDYGIETDDVLMITYPGQ